MDMYEYIMRNKQPVLIVTPTPPAAAAAPSPQKKDAYVDPVQARAKDRKEIEEVRVWWAQLPEDRRQAIREEQFVTKKDKKKEKKNPEPPPKPKASEPPNEAGYSPGFATTSYCSPLKPDYNVYASMQQWAALEM